MKKVLGLDLGTTSIGWALVNESEDKDEKSSIIRLGVRVNPLSTDEISNFEKGKSITTNAERTQKRGMRRNLQRYKLRRDRLTDIFKREGWISDSSILSEDGKDTTFQVINLRAQAAESEISLEEFARVLLNINKRRGYKSNRKADGDTDNVSIAGIDLAKKLKEDNLTPGQYVYNQIKIGEHLIIPQFFQSDLQDEFTRIYEFQKQFHPELTDTLKAELLGCNSNNTWTVCAQHLNIEGKRPNRTTKRGIEQTIENYAWRAKAVTSELGLEELVIVLQEINAGISATNSYLGEIRERSKELEVNDLTVGQLNAKILADNPHENLRNKPYYRNDYVIEFNQIWRTQARFHKELNDGLKKEIQRELFFQRPLKSQKGLVSLCELESWTAEIEDNGKIKKRTVGFKVAPKSSPLFQEFRIWQRLNDIRIDGATLQPHEKEKLFQELSYKENLKDNEIKKLLKVPRASHVNFKEINGNRTLSRLYKAYLDIVEMTGHDIEGLKKLPFSEIRSIVESIFEGLGYNTDILDFNWKAGEKLEENALYRLWHLLYSFEGDSSASGIDKLVSKVAKMLNMDVYCARRIAQVVFEDDYASLSTRAMSRILPYLKQGYQYSDACLLAGYNHSAHSRTREQLDSRTLSDHVATLPKNSLRNPVVEKILNQMANVVNEIIDKYGKPDEVRIEMAREMKQSAEQRKKATSDIAAATKRNEEYIAIIQNEFHIPQPTKNDIIRYRLYDELKDNAYKTLYSNKEIPAELLFTKSIDIEHIIPKAKLFDDSFSNKTLEFRDVNIEKGDSTAIDYVRQQYGDEGASAYTLKIQDLCNRGIISRSKMSKLLTTEDKIPTDFIERDLRNTQYIAKKAIEMLEETVRDVTPTIGAITSRLRSDWQLINLFTDINCANVDPEDGDSKKPGKRTDHRHHAMDALTIAFTKRSYIQYLNTLNASPEEKAKAGVYSSKIIRDKRFIPPMPVDEFRKEAQTALEEILVSVKAKNKIVTENTNISKKSGGVNKKVQLTPRGQLHKETIYGTVRQYVTKDVKVNKQMDAAVIETVASPNIRAALLARLEEFGGNPAKAFTGKNSPDKNPIWLDDMHMTQVPAVVKTVQLKEIHTSRKAITPEITIEKIVDAKIRAVLAERLKEYNNDKNKAFSSLDENPIWLNKEKGIAIKSVTIFDNGNYTPVRCARDKDGNIIRDSFGRPKDTAYMDLQNNHHVAIFEDEEGHLQEHIVPMYEALSSINEGYHPVDKTFNADKGWKFLFTLKSNEYFVFPNEASGFYPEEINLKNPENKAIISPNLFRVQKLSSKYYNFRHHLDTSTNEDAKLRDISWKRITSLDKLKGIVKVRINRIGEIVDVGEY